MYKDDHRLMKLLHRNLSPQKVMDCRVYYDTEIKNEGDLLCLGLHEVPVPFCGASVCS